MGDYLAIDLGAESGRVILGRLQEGRLALQEMHRFSNGPARVDGTLRWDVERIWREILVGLKKAQGRAVRSVSVDSWALDYVWLSGGALLDRAPYCYRDGRTDAPYAEARRDVGEARIYRETGIQFMPINTLYQLLADRDAEDAPMERADRFLMIGDWIHHQLSGVMAQEESNASTTQLWNPIGRHWSGELIEAFGLRSAVFPEVVAPCTVLGDLRGEVQMETGLGAMSVVAGCVHDTGAAVAAVPALGDGWAYISSGTWSLVGAELPKPLISDEAREANFTNETGVGGTSRFLRNASGMWLLQECRRVWAQHGREFSYDEMAKLALEAQPFRSLVNPDDRGFLRPADMTVAIAEFCRSSGQPEPGTVGEFVRCILESLGLLYGSVLGLLEKVTGTKIGTIHIVGGGSQNAALNQMTADATGRVVKSGPTEATAIGNLLLQALTLGEIRTHAELREIVSRSFPVKTFEPSHSEVWSEPRARFETFARQEKVQ
jgi:rhamnulokinase